MEETFTLSLPTDPDGYAPMKCPRCGENFGVTPEGFNADDVLALYCPKCGLQSDDFLTDEVQEMVRRIAENATAGMIASELKELERSLSNELFSVKLDGLPDEKPVQQLVSHSDITPQVTCPYCGRKTKIGIELKAIGATCPYCGMEMKMETTAKDVKKICMEFKSRAGNVINGNCREVAINLNGFLDYVEHTPLLFDYIISCKGEMTAESIRERVYGDGVSYNSEITLKQGVRREEEPWFYYQVLNSVRNDAEKIVWIGNCYGGSGNFQDCTNAFGKYLVEPFVSVINDYMRMMMIELGIDEDARYRISVQQGGQVNIAQDHSVINANVNNQVAEFERLAEEFQKAAVRQGASSDQMTQIIDYLNAIKRGLSAQDLNKSRVAGFTAALKTIVEPMRNAQFLVDIIAKIATSIMQ